MAEKNTLIKILSEAKKALKKEGLSKSEKDEILKLLKVLILSLENHTSSENLEQEARNLSENLISRHSLITLAKQQADELDALKVLSLNLTSSLDLPTVLDAVVKEAMRLVSNTRAIHIYHYANKKLDFAAALDADGQQNQELSKPRKNGLTQTVARKGETVTVEDMKAHNLFKNTPDEWTGSIVGIPLKVKGRVVGVMNLSRSTTGGFSPGEMQLLNMLANQAAVAISNARVHQSISKKAYTDVITGLSNRRALDERLEAEIISAIRTNSSLAVVMMDLDKFKQVNDTYGHQVGDLVLRAVFNVIANGIRSTDFVARYGGDELALILAPSDLHTAILVTNKIIENLARFSYAAPDGNLIKFQFSGGVAIYPDHGRNGSDLLRAADAALYDAKKHSRGTFVAAKGITGPLDFLNLKNHKPK